MRGCPLQGRPPFTHRSLEGGTGLWSTLSPTTSGQGRSLTQQWQERNALQDSHHLFDLGLFTDQQQVVPHKEGQQVLVLGLFQEGL